MNPLLLWNAEKPSTARLVDTKACDRGLVPNGGDSLEELSSTTSHDASSDQIYVLQTMDGGDMGDPLLPGDLYV